MDVQGMKKFFLPCVFLFLLGLAFLPTGAAAGHVNVKSITRDVPDEFSGGEPMEVTLSIEGELPLAVGIVEKIPEGFQFPENDEEVSDAAYFQVDRENGKIAFSALNVTEIKYRVITSSAKGKDGFEGQWVDLLVQTQELDEGKERWESVFDSNTLASDIESRNVKAASGTDTENKEESSVSAPGFGTGLTLLSLLSCLFASRTQVSKGKIGEEK